MGFLHAENAEFLGERWYVQGENVRFSFETYNFREKNAWFLGEMGLLRAENA